MQKLRKLTQEQSILIKDNFVSIKQKFVEKLKNDTLLVDTACSFIANAALEFDPTKTSQTFKDFAFLRCLRRMTDLYREYNHTRRQNRKKKLLNSIKETQTLTKGYCEQADLISELSKLNENPKFYIHKSLVPKYVNFKMIKESLSSEDKSLQQVDWSDTKRHILSSMNTFWHSDRREIYQKLVSDYLIPKAENQDHKTIEEIAKEFNVTESIVMKMLHSDNMKAFILNCVGKEK